MLVERQRLKVMGLVVGDLIVFQAALAITLFVRNGELTDEAWTLNAPPFFVLSWAWVLAFYIAGIYDVLLIRKLNRLFRHFFEGMLANGLIGVVFFYLLPVPGILPRRILLI